MVKINVQFLAKSFNEKDMLTEEQSNYYKQVVYTLADELGKEMNISKLESIIIPDQYKDELFEFQKSIGVKQWCTDDDTGTGFGQVVTKVLNEEKGHTIFLDKKLIAALFDENTLLLMKENMDEQSFEKLNDCRILAINILHHELSHVHEMSMTEDIEWTHNLNIDNDLLKYHLREMAMSIWREYYACRVSAATHQIGRSDFHYIIELSNKIEHDILLQRKNYNLRIIGLNEFVNIFNNRIISLLKFSTYAHGNYFYLKSKDERDIIINALLGELEGNLFKGYWVRLGMVLDELFLKYPNWSTIDIIDDLCKVILEYMEEFNVHIENKHEGLYYKIPINTEEIKR